MNLQQLKDLLDRLQDVGCYTNVVLEDSNGSRSKLGAYGFEGETLVLCTYKESNKDHG